LCSSFHRWKGLGEAKGGSNLLDVVPPCPSKVLRNVMKEVKHHLFGLSKLGMNTMAIELHHHMVGMYDAQMVLRQKRFASDFTLFFARIGIWIANVNLSPHLYFQLALVYKLIWRSCFCSFHFNHMFFNLNNIYIWDHFLEKLSKYYFMEFKMV
jgi:hypothetical protein